MPQQHHTTGFKRAFQNRVPPDYVARTLRRLMPATNIHNLSRERLIEFASIQKKLKHLIQSDPSRFFVPNPGGQKAFLTHWDHDPDRRVLLFLAGNKTGKTTAGALLMGERLLGRPIWNRKEREQIIWPVPAVGIAFAEDFESHRDTVLPTILTWWPRKEIRRISYTANNCPSELTLENGSILKFKTYAQGPDSVEGKDWHLGWFDEPPPHSIYTAAFRGLVATNGRMYVTATLLKEAWLFDEQDQDYARFFAAEIHDNEWISQQAKAEFLDSLSPEEREVRESGKPFSLTGIIYKYFADKEPFVIEPFPLPDKWPYFIGVDPHERRPVHVLFCTIRPEGGVVVLDYLLPRGDTQTIITQIRAKEQELGLPGLVRICIMDPNRGAARQINNLSWEQVFTEAGYDVILGKDDLNIGHSEMYKWLKVDETTKRPLLQFTTNCRGKFGPIYQMTRYAWDDWVHNTTRIEKDIKEKPKNFNKDFPDICRYIAMENPQFDQFLHGPRVIKLQESIHGYGQIDSPSRSYDSRDWRRNNRPGFGVLN